MTVSDELQARWSVPRQVVGPQRSQSPRTAELDRNRRQLLDSVRPAVDPLMKELVIHQSRLQTRPHAGRARSCQGNACCRFLIEPERRDRGDRCDLRTRSHRAANARSCMKKDVGPRRNVRTGANQVRRSASTRGARGYGNLDCFAQAAGSQEITHCTVTLGSRPYGIIRSTGEYGGGRFPFRTDEGEAHGWNHAPLAEVSAFRALNIIERQRWSGGAAWSLPDQLGFSASWTSTELRRPAIGLPVQLGTAPREYDRLEQTGCTLPQREDG